MSCPRCHCKQCRRAAANERMSRFLSSRETNYGTGPMTHATKSQIAENDEAEHLANDVMRLCEELRAG